MKVAKQSEMLAKLKEFGFPVNPHERLCASIDEVIAYCKEWEKKRKELPYDTDGIVVKVNDWAQREKIGYTAKVPKWAKAYKFDPEKESTKLGAVVFHIGKFGELTPVATFMPPVDLAGTTVTHASMHNPEACGGGKWKRLEGYARKERMEIDGLGREVAIQLVESGLVKTIPDLYSLTKEQLLKLEGFKDKKADKLLDGIAASKGRGLARLIAGLAIFRVGDEMADRLAQEFPDIDRIIAATPDELASTEGWGPERVKYLRAFLDGDYGRELIAGLRAAGVKMPQEKRAATGGAPLAGLTIVVTGTLANYDRNTIEKTIKQYGGKTSGSVSKKTSLLLLGELPKPSSKHEDAKTLGIKIINEDEFRKMIGEG